MDAFDRELFEIVTRYRSGSISRENFWKLIDDLRQREDEFLKQEKRLEGAG